MVLKQRTCQPVMSVYKDDHLLNAVPPPLLILQKLPVMSVYKDDLLLEAVPPPLLIPQRVKSYL